MVQYVLVVSFCLALCGGAAQANLIIQPLFDTSITSDPNAVGIENSIDAAIAVFEARYSNPITVKIEFQKGSALGSSQVGFVYVNSYHQYYNALVATDANAAAIAGLTSNGGNSYSNPVTHDSGILLKSANARAVGLSGDPLCNVTGGAGSLTCSSTPGGKNAIDGIISLNTSITYPPQQQAGDYSLEATAEHELDEVLGLGSAIPETSASSGTVTASDPAPEDLFRYTADGALAGVSVSCSGTPAAAYFSYSGATDLAEFNNACNGADFGDWQSNPLPAGVSPEVQDAYATPGSDPVYGPNEIAAMTAIGYVDPVLPLATAEPGTWVLVVVSMVLFASGWRYRRKRASGKIQ